MPSSDRSAPELFFLGSRAYVQAPVQLFLAADGVRRQLGRPGFAGMVVERYKQMRETNGPLRLVAEGDLTPGDEVHAELHLSVDGQDLACALVAAQGPALERRPDQPYLQRDFALAGEGVATATVDRVPDIWTLLDECIQLAKVFHTGKYNTDQQTYRFIVGGLEKVVLADAPPAGPLVLTCRILRHMQARGVIYNSLAMSATGAGEPFTFILPFIGRPKTA